MLDYTAHQSKSNHTWLKIALLTVLLALLLTGGVSLYFFSKFNQPLTYYSKTAVFEVAKGESAREVGRHLEEEKIISSSLAFRLYLILRGNPVVQAGEFTLDSSMSISEIVETLSKGSSLADEIQLTFVEGDTARDYAAQLKAAGIARGEDFADFVKSFSKSADYSFLFDKPALAGLEGYLFPDTYRFKNDASAEAVVEKMLLNFGAKLNSDLRAEISRSGRTVFEVITMASLVEGEVGRSVAVGTKLSAGELDKLENERKLVAGVFYNRLALGMPLQSDATLSYITGIKKSRASLADTQIESSYNTYLHAGLPPGPIGNPSLESIVAAVSPAETDYLYFLSKEGGEAVFGKTLEEHNANKARYLK